MWAILLSDGLLDFIVHIQVDKIQQELQQSGLHIDSTGAQLRFQIPKSNPQNSATSGPARQLLANKYKIKSSVSRSGSDSYKQADSQTSAGTAQSAMLHNSLQIFKPDSAAWGRKGAFAQQKKSARENVTHRTLDENK